MRQMNRLIKTIIKVDDRTSGLVYRVFFCGVATNRETGAEKNCRSNASIRTYMEG